MILFYNKKTGDIIGKIDGRVHSDDILEKSWIQPSNIPKEDVGKYIVPYKPVFETVVENITEMRVVDKKTMRVEEVVVGKKKVKRNKELVPDVAFSKELLEMENGESLTHFSFDHAKKLLTRNKS